MILRSIQVEGWRCFAASVKVAPFADGLNIVHGPNGIGKSTLMMALVRGLFDNHSVTGEQIKTLRPWGRSLNPKVTIEFEHDETEYQLHKQFIGSTSSRLSRMEKGQYVPLAEGRAADEQARQLLSGEPPTRGVTTQQQWGLAQILWATQGNMKIGALSLGTKTTIQDALGAQVAGPGAEILEKRIADTYSGIFTQTGKLRGGAGAPVVVGLQKQRDDAKERRSELADRLDQFDAAGRRIRDLRHRTEQTRLAEEDLAERLEQTRRQAQAYRDLLGQQKLHQEEVKKEEERYKNLNDRICDINMARGELRTCKDDLKRLRDDIPAQEKLVEQAERESGDAVEAVKRVRERREDVTQAQTMARCAARFANARGTVGDAGKLIGQIEEAQEEVTEAREARGKLVAPDAKTFRKIKKVARERDDARLQLDAAVITVTVTPQNDTNVDVTTAEETGGKTLTAGKAFQIKGAPDVGFKIPNVASFQATGPTGSIDKLRDKWEKAAARLDELVAGYGTKDLDRLEQMQEEAAELDSRVSQAEVKVDTLLDGRELDAIREGHARAASEADEIATEYPQWNDTAPDPEDLERQAVKVEEEFKRDIDQAEADKDRADKALQSAREKQTTHSAELKNAERQIDSIGRQVEKLCDDGLDDDGRAKKLTKIALQRDASQGKLDEIDEEIQGFGDDPGKSVTILDGQLDALRNDAATNAKRLNTEEGRVEQILSEAPYSGLAAEEEKINRLEQDIVREHLQINAVRLLYETLAERRRAVLDSVIGPVRLRANRTLERISGTRFQDIAFDGAFLPCGVAPRNMEESVPLDQISGGEREQLYFAVRLALADVAFGDDRQLVVLDDVFTYTDTARLARIVTVLDEVAQRYQIVILTCHPERYRGLPNATFFDLEAIVSGTSS